MKPSHSAYDAVKRILDIVVAALMLALLSPVIVIVAVLVRVSLGSPVLFSQQRPGKDGVPFTLRKFRTMVASDNASAETAVSTDSQRLTTLGRVLRSTSIDELPELWNVLVGEMSLIGPRPLLMEYLERYSPQQARRHQVRPGLTGWAQVNGRNALSWEERFELDVWYVDNRSLLLDLKIVAKTVATVVKREGVSAAGHATMAPFDPTKPRNDAEEGA